MIIARLVGVRVVGWFALVMLAGAGLAALVGGVEAARLGPGAALAVALGGTPGVIVALSPTVAALGAALAAARTAALGEQLALDASGVHPLRPMLVAMALGGTLGAGQWLLADQIVWRAEAPRRAVLPSPAEAVEWVWLDDGALRVTDGTFVRLSKGRILETTAGESFDENRVLAGRMRQQPQTASGAALRKMNGERAGLERHRRLARGVACALLAAIGWLLGRTGGMLAVAGALAVALVWQGGDALLVAAAAQGQLPARVGAWGGVAIAVGLSIAAARRALG